MQHQDWGMRSPRWSGVRSETLDVAGTSAHVLRAEPDSATPGATTHLLLHGLAGSGTLWLDAMRPLSAFGPVVAPDLPGTVIGETTTPSARHAKAKHLPEFLAGLTDALGLRRLVVHGLSMGGLAAVQFAAFMPERVERVVLANPAMPFPLGRYERLGWQTLGRFALAAGPAVARGLVRVWGRRLVDTKLAYLTDPEKAAVVTAAVAGGDVSRVSPESLALVVDQMRELRSTPKRLANAATAGHR